MHFLLRIVFSCLILCSIASNSYATLQTSNETDINFGKVSKSLTGTVTSTKVGGSLKIIETRTTRPFRRINITFENNTSASGNCSNAVDASTIRLKNFVATYDGTALNLGTGYGPVTRTNLVNPRSGKTLTYSATIEVSKDAVPSIANAIKNACIIITIDYNNGGFSAPIIRNRPQSVIIAGADMTLIETQAMNFKKIIKPTSAGTIKMATDGTMTPTGITLLNGTAGLSEKFDLSVEKNVQLLVSAPANAASGGMFLDNFRLKTTFNGVEKPLTTGNTAFLTNSTINTTMNIGATLHIDGTATAGVNKSVPYTIIFTYQ